MYTSAFKLNILPFFKSMMIDSKTVPTGSTTKESPCLLPSSGCTAHHSTGQYIKTQGSGARNSNFIKKVSRLRRWWTRVPKNHLTQVRIQASFILKGLGVWLAVANFSVPLILCSCCCPHWSGHSAVIYHQQNKCSVTFHLYMKWKNIMPLKVRALKMDRVFQAVGNILSQKLQSQHRRQSTKK